VGCAALIPPHLRQASGPCVNGSGEGTGTAGTTTTALTMVFEKVLDESPASIFATPFLRIS